MSNEINPDEVVVTQSPDRINPDEVVVGKQPVAGPIRSVGQELSRQVGLTGRAVATAVGSVGAIPADFIGNAVNAVAGKEIIPNQRRGLQRTLTRMGLPEAETGIERFTQQMAESAPAFALPGTLPAQIAGNAGVGYANAERPQDAGTDAAIGGAFGAGGQAVARVVSGLVKPTAEAKRLLEAGVPLTTGQQAGGALRYAEDRLARTPLFGATLRKRQEEALQGYQAASREAAMPPGSIGPSNTVDDVHKALGAAYEQALAGHSVDLAKMPTAGQIMAQVGRGREANLTTRAGRALSSKLQVLSELGGGGSTVDAVHLQMMESELKQAAFRFKSSLDPNQKAYGDLLADMADTIRANWRGQLPEASRNAVTVVDDAWSRFVPIRKASTKTDATLTDPEAYLPKAVLQQLRDRPANGQRILAEAAHNVIGSRHPKPTEIGFGVASGLSGLTAGMGNPVAVPVAAVASLAYGSKPAQRFMTGNSALNSEALANALRRSTPITSASNNEEHNQ